MKATHRTGPYALIVALDRTAYTIGEMPLVKVTLVNHSAGTIKIDTSSKIWRQTAYHIQHEGSGKSEFDIATGPHRAYSLRPGRQYSYAPVALSHWDVSRLVAGSYTFALSYGKVDSNLATFTIADAPSPAASAGVLRLGYVAPTAQDPIRQHVLDRYGRDVRQRLEATFSVATVLVAADRAQTVASDEICRESQLFGFLEPHRHWQATPSSVTVDAELELSDCNGNIFFEGDISRSEKHDDSVLVQAQLDAAQTLATDDLLRKLSAYKQLHEAAWDLLMKTGSLSESTASPSPA